MQWRLKLVALTGWASAVAKNFVPQRLFSSLDVASPIHDTFPITLNATGQTLALDYGSRPKYSEEFGGLQNPFSDGPYAFSVGLSGTFRTETFNITEPGTVKSFFVQGGQRWQSITQLTGGSLTVTEVGFIPSAEIPDLEELPGQFACSNSDYNAIWKLGALASSAACLESGTQNQTWEITSEGALVRGQKPALSALGMNLDGYSLKFSSKIVRGATGWAVAQPSSSSGIQLLLVSELPEATTFVNVNETITPPNSLVLAYGFSFVNQTTLPSRVLDTFKVPFIVKEGEWYEIETSLFNASDLTVRINGRRILGVTLGGYGVSLSNPHDPTAVAGAGSWGFGPWQDQVAVYTNVEVTAENGTVLYKNDLNTEGVLAEYGVARNNATVCLDGPKRDRLVWLGDFFHTTRIIAASTGRRDHVLGTLGYMQQWQNEEGLAPIAPPMGYNPIYASQLGGYRGLVDYQTLGLLAFTGYFKLTGDVDFAKQFWPGFKKQLNWLIGQINSTTHLAEISGFTGPASGTATSAQLVQALNEAALVAEALTDTVAASEYRAHAATLADAMEKLLWSDSLGVYVTSLTATANFSVADISFAITSGLAGRNATRQASLLKALQQLWLGPGFKDSSSVAPTGSDVNISPNTNGFLLSALMTINATVEGKFLLDNLWTAMITNDSTTTGASWEYVNADDRGPGLGLFTSLSHPWGGAPTYVMPQWIAGIRPVTPGYEKWVLSPAIEGFDLDWARAQVPTRYGDLSVRWQLHGKTLHVNVTAPKGTSGSFALPRGKSLGGWSVNGKPGSGGISMALDPGVSSITVEL